MAVVGTSTASESDPAASKAERVDRESWRHRRIVAVVSVLVVALVAILVVVTLPRAIVPPELGASPELIGHVLLLAAALLVFEGLLACGEGYLAGTFVVATMGPWVAGTVSVMTYLLTTGDAHAMAVRAGAVYDGIAAGVAGVAALAFLGVALSTPKRAQARMYDNLQDRYNQVKARYEKIVAWNVADADRKLQNATLMAEACSRLDEVELELCDENKDRAALRWALATGYSSLQRTLHRIEEMIVAAQPTPAVTGDALHDALRLTDSTIGDHDTLSTHLRTAMQTISANSASTFFALPGASIPPARDSLPTEAEAREVLREIRFAVNDFRDNRVDGLIRARNRLLWVVLIVGMTAYLALGLALINGVSSAAVSAVSILFLVGALAGLINRLRIEAMRSTAVEDYGLHLARLIAAPLLSGLAGVAGVYLVAKTPELLTVVSPTEAQGTATPLDISAIFDLQRNQAALLLAAVFGLVPSQLISSLQRQAERFQADLEKSEPSGGSTQTEGGNG